MASHRQVLFLHIVHILVVLELSLAEPEAQERSSVFLSKVAENAIGNLQAVARFADPQMDHSSSIDKSRLRRQEIDRGLTAADSRQGLYTVGDQILHTRRAAGIPATPSSWIELHGTDPLKETFPVSLLSYMDIFQRFRKGSTASDLTRNELRSMIVAILGGFKSFGPTGQQLYVPIAEDIDPLEYSMTDLRGVDPSRLTVLYRIRAPDLATATTWRSMIGKDDLRHGFQRAATAAYKQSHIEPSLIPGLEQASVIQMPFAQVFENNEEFKGKETLAEDASVRSSLAQGTNSHFSSGSLRPKQGEAEPPADIIRRTPEASEIHLGPLHGQPAVFENSLASEQHSSELLPEHVADHQALSRHHLGKRKNSHTGYPPLQSSPVQEAPSSAMRRNSELPPMSLDAGRLVQEMQQTSMGAQQVSAAAAPILWDLDEEEKKVAEDALGYAGA